MKKQFPTFLPAWVVFLTGTLLFTGCEPEDDTVTVTEPTFTNGIMVTNEGQYLKGNGDVSFINHQSKEIVPDLFSAINNRPAGDIVQSMTFHEESAYLIANNSAKIEVVNARTFKSTGVIANLKQPRYMLVANNKGYVTEHIAYGKRGQISVIDLATNAVIKTIPASIGPERMVYLNNKLFVANSGSDLITVINTNSNTVEDSISVTNGPGSLILDANNKIWALSAVSFSGLTGGLTRINPATNTVEFNLNFSGPTTAFRSDLKTDGARNTLYFTYAGKVYKMGITETTLPAAFINRDFYSIGIDQNTKTLYAGDAGDMASRGKVIVYNLSGQPADSMTVGIAPNDFYFR